jgi:hypothetical protein
LLGAYHVTGAQVLNVITDAITAALLWRWIRSAAGSRAAAIALIALLLLPLRTWMSLDYSHHFLASAFFFAAILVAARVLAPSSPLARGERIALGAMLALLIALESLQQSIDILTLATIAIASPPLLLTGARGRKGLADFAVMMAVALLIALPVRGTLNRWLASNDVGQMCSGPVSFMARGWSFETLGEYNSRYELMDRITPHRDKRDEMAAVVISRLSDQPADVFFRLIPAKIAKYFLIGYASGVEDALRMGGMPGGAALATGTRIVFAPVFLSLASLSAWRASRRRPPRWLVISGVAIVLTSLAFVIFGETSPRYSIYIQPLLCAFIAWGMTEGRDKKTEIETSILPVAALLAAACIAVALACHALARIAPAKLHYLSMTAGSGQSLFPHEPYLRSWTVNPADPAPSFTLQIPHRSAAALLSLHLWPVGMTHGDSIRVMCGEKECWKSNAKELRPARRVECVIPPGDSPVRIEYITETGGPQRSLQVGFARICEPAKETPPN